VALENLHLMLNTNPIDFVSSHELYQVAIAFSLLRQGGHYVNAGLFNTYSLHACTHTNIYYDEYLVSNIVTNYN